MLYIMLICSLVITMDFFGILNPPSPTLLVTLYVCNAYYITYRCGPRVHVHILKLYIITNGIYIKQLKPMTKNCMHIITCLMIYVE